MRKFLFSMLLTILLCGSTSAQIRFTVGADTHAHGSGGPLASNDLFSPGHTPNIETAGGTPLVNVDAFSFGQAPSAFPDPNILIGFSVTSSSLGAAGTSVENQRLTDFHRSDVFNSLTFSLTNQLEYDGDGNAGPLLGIQENPANDPNGLNGLDYREFSEIIYWSIDSADTSHAAYPGSTAADVFVHSVTPGYSVDAGGLVTYADSTTLGLTANDNIDALEIIDLAGDTDFVLAEDTILFSLTSNSDFVTSNGFSGADIFAFGGAFGTSGPVLWQDHSEIGLQAGDDVDALSLKAIPEPSSALLIGIGALGLVFRRRRSLI